MENDKTLELLKKALGANRVKNNELMSLHTSCKIGGVAKYYFEAETSQELMNAFLLAHKLQVPVFVIGSGSSVLFSDSGFLGLIIKNNTRKFEVYSLSGSIKNRKINFSNTILYTESGAFTNQVVRYTLEHSLSGLEYQLGLPGTIGGAISMNAAYLPKKAYISDSLSKVKICTKEGQLKEVEPTYLKTTAFLEKLKKGEEIIVSLSFLLKSGDKSTLWQRGEEASLYRSTYYPNGMSLGLAFGNISLSEAMKIPTPQSITDADFLIKNSGIVKKQIGDAAISALNPNFITNQGSAQAKDVLLLLNEIQKSVKNKFGVALPINSKLIGFNG